MPPSHPPSPVSSSPSTWLLALAALVAGSGCGRTDILVAPHTSPRETSSGVVVHTKALQGQRASVGVVAVNDGKTEVTWEVREGGRSVWACFPSADGRALCQQASYSGGEPLKDRISFLAPAIPRTRDLAPTEEKGEGARRDRVDERPAVPHHGVWATGKVRFATASLFHCTVEQGAPICAQAATTVFPYLAYSRHLIDEAGQIHDVLWAAQLFTPIRCVRAPDRLACQPVTFAHP